MADYYNLKQGVTYQFQILLCKHGIDYSKDVQFQLIKTTCPLRTDDIFADERGVTATVQGFYGLGGSHDTVTDENRNVTIDATYGSGNTTTTNVSMEAGSVATMSSGQVSSATILTNEADVCFDGDVVDQMAKNGEPINFSVDRTENQGTVTLDFALTGGEQEIIPESSASTNGTVTITTDYGDIPGGKTIQVNYVPDNGEAQKIDATYDATTGEVSFKTSHFSKYEIVLTENPCNGKHSFTVYKTIKDATCTQDGEKVAICDNCKVATDTKIIQKTGHQFTRYETTKAATCTTDGEETAICDNCKTAKDTKTVAKTGHSYVNGACEHCGGLDTSCDGGEGCPTHSYKDIKATAWYHTMGYVDYVVGHKIMIGTGTNPLTFQPEEEMTRAEMVTALWNLAGKPAATKAPSFTDVKEKDWFYAPIAWAYEMELAVGMENGTFQPDEALTREQMVTFLYRYARLKGQNVTAGTIAEKFTDKAKVAEYAQKPFAWAIEQGIITGMGTTPETLAPTAKAERCQLAKILTVYLQTAAA